MRRCAESPHCWKRCRDTRLCFKTGEEASTSIFLPVTSNMRTRLRRYDHLCSRASLPGPLRLRVPSSGVVDPPRPRSRHEAFGCTPGLQRFLARRERLWLLQANPGFPVLLVWVFERMQLSSFTAVHAGTIRQAHVKCAATAWPFRPGGRVRMSVSTRAFRPALSQSGPRTACCITRSVCCDF